MILIIFVGIRSGIFTASESSAIAVIYAIFATVAVYRTLKWKEFVAATLGAVRTASMVLLVIGCAASFAWLLAYLKIPTMLASFIGNISDNAIVILLMLNIALLFLGTFMDMAPLIVVTTPIFLPVATLIGVDPVHFGIIMILNLGIGLCTPPVGSVLFVSCAVGKIPIGRAMKTIWPFYFASLFVLALVTYIPALTLWLPSLFH